MLQDDLWQTIQRNIHEATGRQLPDDIIARYHMQQLLAPGALCQQALSHALLELEQPLSRYNDSLQQVQRHLTAAAQVCCLPHILVTLIKALLLASICRTVSV